MWELMWQMVATSLTPLNRLQLLCKAVLRGDQECRRAACTSYLDNRSPQAISGRQRHPVLPILQGTVVHSAGQELPERRLV